MKSSSIFKSKMITAWLYFSKSKSVYYRIICEVLIRLNFPKSIKSRKKKKDFLGETKDCFPSQLFSMTFRKHYGQSAAKHNSSPK